MRLWVVLLGFVLQGESVRPPPAELKVASFYKKYLDADGLPILSSEKVPDTALRQAKDIVTRMLVMRPDVRKAIVERKIRVAIMAKSEVTTDIPEHSDLNRVFPGTDWNKRCRGVGATLARPVCSGAEENLLGLPEDRYRGESILLHEFAHTIHEIGMAGVDAAFGPAVEKAYGDAIAKGLWKKTYAGTNAKEYWAEGVQSWFDANLESTPANGIHNEINTREELKKYDPALAALIAQVFPDDAWRFSYPKKPLR